MTESRLPLPASTFGYAEVAIARPIRAGAIAHRRLGVRLTAAAVYPPVYVTTAACHPQATTEHPESHAELSAAWATTVYHVTACPDCFPVLYGTT